MTSTITNLDDSKTLQYAIIDVEDSMDYMGSGEINWEKITNDYTIISVGANNNSLEEITQKDTWYLLVMHNPASDVDDVLEVRVVNDYGDDKYLDSILLSIPSLWITGFVVFRIYRLKKSNRELYDSTPSHAWGESE